MIFMTKTCHIETKVVLSSERWSVIPSLDEKFRK